MTSPARGADVPTHEPDADSDSDSDAREYPVTFNAQVDHSTGQAVFGLDVLSHVVAGLEAELSASPGFRSLGPAVLGCALWMDDPDLMDVLSRISNVCVVIRKQDRNRYRQPDAGAVLALAEQHGLPQYAFPQLADLAPRGHDGLPALLGPFDRLPIDATVPAVRELGFRKAKKHRHVPTVHAKLLLVGELWWHDEHPEGYADDITGFRPTRLWVGSANFTASSRKTLEMGMWTADAAQLATAQDWLLRLVESSEPVGAGSDDLMPEYAPIDVDLDEITDYMRDSGWSAPVDGE